MGRLAIRVLTAVIAVSAVSACRASPVGADNEWKFVGANGTARLSMLPSSFYDGNDGWYSALFQVEDGDTRRASGTLMVKRADCLTGQGWVYLRKTGDTASAPVSVWTSIGDRATGAAIAHSLCDLSKKEQ